MNLLHLALRNITGSAFRSWVVALCALLLASFSLATALVVGGAQESLNRAISRLGADILVVPDGTEGKVESAILMGVPTRVWMPQANLEKIRGVTGVAAVSPQLYLSTLKNASCCTASEMFLVAFDPSTDFTIQPWIQKNLRSSLTLGEAVGGRYVFLPEGDKFLQVYGYMVTLMANTEPTGTALDQSLYFTFDTARDIARLSYTRAVEPLEIPTNSISTALIKVSPEANISDVAARISAAVPGVNPIPSANLFQSYRVTMSGLLNSFILILGITWVMAILLIGLIFSMAANERRRHLGILRALGATRGVVFRTLVLEAALLAAVGALTGAALSSFAVFLFRSLIINTMGVPFFIPAFPSLVAYIAGGALLVMVFVSLAAMLPAYRISRMEPASAVRD
jgi:putative ABC transport system permease protein